MVEFLKRSWGLSVITSLGIVVNGALYECHAGPLDPTPSSEEKTADPPAVDPAPPTNEFQDYEDFAWEFVDAIWEEDLQRANALIDWDTILDAAAPPLGDSAWADEWRREFFAGFKSAMNGPNGVAARIVTFLNMGGDFTFLRTRNVDGQQRVIFRQIQAEGGADYYDMIVKRRHDGALRAVDIYTVGTGELLTDSLRRTILRLLRSKVPALLGALSLEEQEYVDALPKLRQMDAHRLESEPDKALEVYRTLPQSVREHKMALLLRLRAALDVDDAEYLAAIDDFRRLFPEDRVIGFLTIDWYTLKKEYDKAIEGLVRFEEEIGGDPYLQVLRASILIAQDKVDEAKAVGRAALEEEATLLEGYWLLVTISLSEEDFPTTAQLLQIIETDLEVELEDLTTVEGYEGFVKSEAYRNWQAERAQEPQ